MHFAKLACERRERESKEACRECTPSSTLSAREGVLEYGESREQRTLLQCVQKFLIILTPHLSLTWVDRSGSYFRWSKYDVLVFVWCMKLCDSYQCESVKLGLITWQILKKEKWKILIIYTPKNDIISLICNLLCDFYMKFSKQNSCNFVK